MSFSHWLVMTAVEKKMGENLIEKEGDPLESDKVWEGRAMLYKILRLIKLGFFFFNIYPTGCSDPTSPS